MKRLVGLFLLVVLLLPLVSVQAQLSLPETYVEPEGDFMFNYPRGWELVTGGFLGIEISIPNNYFVYMTFSIRETNDFEEALDFYLDSYGGEIEELTSEDRPAANLIIHEDYTYAIYAVNFAPNKIAVLDVMTTIDQWQRFHSTFEAIRDSVRVPEESEIPVVVEAEDAPALDLDGTYEDRAVTFDYPNEWFSSSYQGKIAVSNVRGLAEYREPEFVYVNSEQVVILIYPDVASLPSLLQMFLEENPTPEDVASMVGIGVLVEGDGRNNPDVEKFRSGRREAAHTIVSSDSEDYLIMAVELENGEIATVIMISEVGEIHDYRLTARAIVDTLEAIN